ncbi:hypothetical protein KY386_03370 [Candidatus Parcubacteria bacterium]|nr:hypothetical protein [Candidatus Parcubacteria bacterium]
MAQNFLDEDGKSSQPLSYMDGFRFGLGQFVAWLLGTVLIAGLGLAVAALLKLR